MSVISMKQLLEAGVHFGHQTSTQSVMVSISSTYRNL